MRARPWQTAGKSIVFFLPKKKITKRSGGENEERLVFAKSVSGDSTAKTNPYGEATKRKFGEKRKKKKEKKKKEQVAENDEMRAGRKAKGGLGLQIYEKALR